ncbi:hypothetical protein AMK20_32660, partial [Streptomyces sp. TSRI0261]
IRLAAEEHHLVISLHHIASDAWSQRLLVEELSTAYGSQLAGGSGRPGEALQLQYADIAAWEVENASPDSLEPGLAYWRER